MIDFQPHNDEELVKRHLSGDKDAFSVLIKKYTGAVYSVILSRIPNNSAAEDLAQQTFLTALKSIKNIRDPGKFGCWIYGVARNTCLDWFRENRKFTRPLSGVNENEMPASTTDVSGQSPDGSDDVDELKKHLLTLPEEQQEVINLLYSENMSYKEMSELLEVSAATVNKRLTLARNTLRLRMKRIKET